MNRRTVSSLSNHALRLGLVALQARDCQTTAEFLIHLAEFEARRLYAAEGYPSMLAWCIGELHFCEQTAFKRRRAARMARRFPSVLAAVADGRLHLTAVVLLSTHLTQDNADELIAAATHRSRREIELYLAERFPQADVPTVIRALSDPVPAAPALSPGIVESVTADDRVTPPLSPGQSYAKAEASWIAGGNMAPAAIPTPEPYPRVTPLAPERFGVQFTIGQGTHDKLRRVQELLGHQVAAGDLAEVMDRALEALMRELEKRKFAATSKPRSSTKPLKTDTRYIPAEVKRAVRARDQDQCTFKSESGQRCPARTDLEFDHIQEFARGGKATVGNLRLRCHAHNQYEAECTFGAEFMKHRRESAQRDRERLANSA